MAKKIIFIFSILILPLFVEACFSPVDHFAVEVLLNKEGIYYNLSFFNNRGEEEVKREEGGIIYLSHFDPRVAVILRETENKLSVRLQIPTKGVEREYGFDLVPAVGLDPENFNWKEALKKELLWLRENQIIKGLSDEDIEKICLHAKNGNAGFNQKIVWGKKKETKDFTWLSYSQTENPILLKRMGCGGFEVSLLPKKQISVALDEEKICRDLCGDGICQEIVCMAQGCPCPETPESCPQDCRKEWIIGLPNPASVFCKNLGYELEIRKDERGNEYGVCVFPDGKECEEWAFYRGECGAEYHKIKIDLKKTNLIFAGEKPRKIEEFSGISLFIQTSKNQKVPIEVEIEREKKLIRIKEGEVVVKSEEIIKIENKILKIETPKGESVINISPKEALQIVNEKIPQTTKEIILKVEKDFPVYEIKGAKREKLFGLFKINLPLQTLVNAASGEIVKVKMNFFIKILDLLSFK